MKKLFNLSFLLICFQIGAQIGGGLTTNTFPDNGNAGIGTLSPTEKLEVIGKVKAEESIFYKSLPNNQIFSSTADRNLKSRLIGAGTITDASYDGRTFNFYDFPSSNIDSNPSVFLGINDRTARRRLQFYAYSGSHGEFKLFDKNAAINFRINDDGNNNIYLDMPKSNSRLVIGQWGSYLPEHKLVVTGSSMIEGNILTEGNIGIGTNSFADMTGSYRLSVDGGIRSHRIRVYTDWADFVFEKNYALPSLEEVEAHILEKGHLKDIPSAKEVEINGIDLGEMNKLLLQKIEELTLYLIEKDKQFRTLENEVKVLKEQISTKD